MANIVELRDFSSEVLIEKLEDARAEMFNLRFQNAAARLSDTNRIRIVRREIAQMETLLHQRQLAIDLAAKQPDTESLIAGKAWTAVANFNYEDSAWLVKFSDESGSELAVTHVNLNKKRPKTRRERRA